jgi:lipopolysaccharide heptosyltransferase II
VRSLRVAISAPHWVGDLVMATPVLEAALSADGVGEVHVLCREHLAPLLAGGPLEPRLRTHSGSDGEVALLREIAPDAVLVLSNSFGSAWRAWRARVPIRAGSALHGRRWFLTHAVVPPTLAGRRFPIPTAHLLRDVGALLGIQAPNLHPRLHVSAEEREHERGVLAGLGLGRAEPYVLCTPGAAFGAAKLWPPEHFARALDLLHAQRGWRGVVSGAPGEEPQIEAVVSAAKSPVISLASARRTLGTLKALVHGAELLLVGDSGPRWVAAAFDVPCVSVLGPNIPELTASSLELCEVVRVQGLACSPCARRKCPLGHHRCMRGLAPEAVVAAAERVLARSVAHRGVAV